jgi:hypothetical protein
VQREPVPLLRRSVYSRLAGYENTNDVMMVAKDPPMKALARRWALEGQKGIVTPVGRLRDEGSNCVKW